MSLSDKRASFGEKIVDSGDKQLPQTCFAGKSSILNRFKKADPWQKERWIRDSLCCLWTCGGVIIQSKYRMKSFIHLVSFVRIALPTFCFNMDCEYNMHAAFLHGYSKFIVVLLHSKWDKVHSKAWVVPLPFSAGHMMLRQGQHSLCLPKLACWHEWINLVITYSCRWDQYSSLCCLCWY